MHKPIWADQKQNDKEQIARIDRLLDRPLLDPNAFRQKMSLAKFLAAIEAQLPRAEEIKLSLDAKQLGKDLARIAAAEVPGLPAVSKKVSVHYALSAALGQVSKNVELDYGILPSGIVITRPQSAAYSHVYDLRGIVYQAPLLFPQSHGDATVASQKTRSADDPAKVVGVLMNGVDLRPWETIQILNGIRLELFASRTRHKEISELLEALRRLADVAVIMNARLYEVDRAFFSKRVAPLFVKEKGSKERPVVIPIEGALLKAITQQKLLLESEDIKIYPEQKAVFLSLHSAFRHGAAAQQASDPTDFGMTGVSFEVRPLVSRDRRYLRLQISQEVAQLIAMDKAKKLDVSTGKQVEIEAPNLRRTAITGTVQIPDGNPILMPVDFAPPGKGHEDRLWLMLARPFIWIEDEVKDIRKQGGDLSAKSIWEKEPEKDDTPAPATRLPLNDDVKQILQAIITDVLTNPRLKGTREFYGTASDRTLALEDGDKLGWPKDFKPETYGHTLVEVRPDPFVNRRRVLGIRLDKFELNQKKSDKLGSPIEVCVSNAGGDQNGAVIGGCSVYYTPKRRGLRWIVEFDGLLDP
jgi:hypothetical protein